MAEQRKYVLVVDDDLTVTALVRFHLENAGYRVAVAHDGHAALKIALQGRFDAVVTDHQMPLMSGTDLCDRLRQEAVYAHTPIIFLTAKGLEIDTDLLRDELNVAATFFKPFSPTELMRTVHACVSQCSP
jgi:DNA-binding response OmpR family regulator